MLGAGTLYLVGEDANKGERGRSELRVVLPAGWSILRRPVDRSASGQQTTALNDVALYQGKVCTLADHQVVEECNVKTFCNIFQFSCKFLLRFCL